MKKCTSIYINEDDINRKKEIEKKFDWAKISNTAIYRRGLESFENQAQIPKINALDN